MESRVESACDACGVVDDLPRHHITVLDPYSPPDGLKTVSRHFECCLEAGCPDQSCITAQAAYKARAVA